MYMRHSIHTRVSGTKGSLTLPEKRISGDHLIVGTLKARDREARDLYREVHGVYAEKVDSKVAKVK